MANKIAILVDADGKLHDCRKHFTVRELREAAEGAYQMLLLSGKRPERLRKALEAVEEK